jgi:hypothetical protein
MAALLVWVIALMASFIVRQDVDGSSSLLVADTNRQVGDHHRGPRDHDAVLAGRTVAPDEAARPGWL